MRIRWLVSAALVLGTVALLVVVRPPWAETAPREVPWVSRDLDPPPAFLRSLEETTLDRGRWTLVYLKNSTPEKMDEDSRHIWRNGTPKKGTGAVVNVPLRYALHQMGHILRLAGSIPGGDGLLSDARDLFRNLTDALGYMPGYDLGCAGPYSLLGVIDQVLPRDHPAIVNMTRRLVDLRVASGGWVVLDYSRANRTGGGPYVQAASETTPAAILTLRRAGYTLEDPVIQGAIRSLDRSVLEDAYREEYPEDYMVGNGWVLLSYKKNGIRSLDAFRKARGELVGEILRNHSDPDRIYLVSIGLLGLQGFIPEGSEPYRLGLEAIRQTYDPANHTWRANGSTLFGRGFFNTTSYNMGPLMVLHRKGYNGSYLDTLLEPPPALCGPPRVSISEAPGGLRVQVRSPAAQKVEVDYTTDGYRTIGNASLSGGAGEFSGVIPRGDFQLVFQCGPGYELSSWYRP
ncbi:MAG: hypothetical protein HY558_03990 [Euryarchaeota archaeon]|nr:hypothetical protein [Euryarchaeota archaeon]